MKKIIVAILSLLVGTVGYTIVDKTIETRVSDLESKVSYLEEIVEFYHSDYSIENETLASGLTKSEFIDFFNKETAKAAKGTYKFNRNCSYTDPIDVGNATDALNKVIKTVDENADLSSVVGGFLGIGTKAGTFPQDSLTEKYRLTATSLKLSHIETFSYSDGVYTFTLANAKSPKKTPSTPFASFTNDFITHDEIDSSIKNTTGSLISLKSTDLEYTNIKVSVKVVDGKISEINYQYELAANLEVKILVGNVNGYCASKTVATYSDIIY